MFETVAFPVAYCSICARDVIITRELDDADRWCDSCARCGTGIEPDVRRREVGATSVIALGYALDGATTARCGPNLGCSDCTA